MYEYALSNAYTVVFKKIVNGQKWMLFKCPFNQRKKQYK